MKKWLIRCTELAAGWTEIDALVVVHGDTDLEIAFAVDHDSDPNRAMKAELHGRFRGYPVYELDWMPVVPKGKTYIPSRGFVANPIPDELIPIARMYGCAVEGRR